MAENKKDRALAWLEEMLYAEKRHCKERDYASDARRTVEAIEWLHKLTAAIKEGDLR